MALEVCEVERIDLGRRMAGDLGVPRRGNSIEFVQPGVESRANKQPLTRRSIEAQPVIAAEIT
jgi:hypothetical protein